MRIFDYYTKRLRDRGQRKVAGARVVRAFRPASEGENKIALAAEVDDLSG